MSNTPPDYEEVEEGSPYGGAECEESSPEPQPPEEQDADHLYPLLYPVEYLEEPEEASGSKAADSGDTVYDVNAADSTGQVLDENTNALQALEADDQLKEQSFQTYNDEQKTYFEDFMYSNTSSFDEGSNSTFDDTREEPKGSPLARFSKIAKAVEIAEYETLQLLYQLLYQRSAWDTQEILSQRILEFSGFNFSQKSEDYFNREMMLRTQPNEVLVKIGAILGLHQVQKMLFDMDSGRVELISGIMYFLSRPNKRTHAGLKCVDEASETVKTPQPKTPSKCGCRNRCFRKFSAAQQKRLTEYMKELEEKNLTDNYLLSLMECRKIIREPNENCKKLKEVTYNYKCKFGKKEAVVCKGAFITLHGVKMRQMNNLQLKLKSGVNLPKINLGDFPPIVSEEDAVPERAPSSEPAPSRKLDLLNNKKTWMSSEDQVRRLEEVTENLKAHNVLPKVVVEKCDINKAISELKSKNKADEKSPTGEESSQLSKEKVKLKDLPLVVTAIESSSEELLLDVHFLLFLNSADADKVKENILEFEGFAFDCDSEEYDERIEFLQRMSGKIVSDVARSFSLEILSTKAATVKNILTFLTKPDESFLKIASSMPLSLSDVELDDIGDMSDSDGSITCEVVEKKVECIDLLSSGEDSDREDKPRKEKKASPQKTAILKQALVSDTKPPVAQPQKPQLEIRPAVTVSNTTTQPKPTSTPGKRRCLRNFETICKIVNTHPHEYLVDIHELLYLKTHDPSTLRDDILNFSGFNFDRTAPEYVKRKQLLDRMLYNSVRRIYNTLIHNTTEVKVFSKPTMITEIFQFLFNLPPNDTSIRPHPTVAKTPVPTYIPPVIKNVTPSLVSVTPAAAASLPIQSGKLSDLKRVFQRVACFPCEYLVDVHKLLFMTDCDSKVIRNNIFAFKGFDFTSKSQQFTERKMYLEYLTFHSLRKISSVLTTRSVDLRNSTKHELATHLTQVLAEYCSDNQSETNATEEETNNQSNEPNVTSSSTAVENIVVTPIIDPSYANPHSDMEIYNPNSATNSASDSSPKASAPPSLSISIVDARSINSPSVSTTTSSAGRRKRAPTKVQTNPAQTDIQQYQGQQLYTQSLNIYSPNVPTIAGIASLNAPGIVSIPILKTYTQPIQAQPTSILGLSQSLGSSVNQVPNKKSEIIVPGECLTHEPEDSPPLKKAKISSPKDSKSINNKIRDAINSDDEDCDKPLSSLVGHPIDSVLKKHIVDIVEESNLASITINGVIQKIFNMYPKFDLSYRKEFIKSTLRSMLYRLGDQKNPGISDKRETNSPDCSVTTTEDCENSLEESPASAMECS